MTKWEFTNKEKTKIKDEFGNVWDFDYIINQTPAMFCLHEVARTYKNDLKNETPFSTERYLSDEELDIMKEKCQNSGIITNERIDEIFDIMKRNEVAIVTYAEYEEIEKTVPLVNGMFGEYKKSFGNKLTTNLDYSIENIQKIVDSLKNCRNCFNVFFAENCESCQISYNIKNCKNSTFLRTCSNCINSDNLGGCVDCKDCEGCRKILNCVGMKNCNDCKDCSNCTEVQCALNCHNCIHMGKWSNNISTYSAYYEEKDIFNNNFFGLQSSITVLKDDFYINKNNKNCEHLDVATNCENCIGGHYFENLKDFNLWQTENALEILKKHRKIPDFLKTIELEILEGDEKFSLFESFLKDKYQKKQTIIGRLFGRKR